MGNGSATTPANVEQPPPSSSCHCCTAEYKAAAAALLHQQQQSWHQAAEQNTLQQQQLQTVPDSRTLKLARGLKLAQALGGGGGGVSDRNMGSRALVGSPTGID